MAGLSTNKTPFLTTYVHHPQPSPHLHYPLWRRPRTILGIGGWIGRWKLWAKPFALLSSTWRIIAYDHRGSGATIALVDTITVALHRLILPL